MSLQHIIVGMSGGVDSAIAAYLLKSAGHMVEAIFMKNWEEDDSPEYCSAAHDLADAEKVCEQLGIHLRTVNFSDKYWDKVFEYFLAEHRAGRTPNPDILCNTEIKFKAFLDHAASLGAEKIATGHYAKCIHASNCYQLHTGHDANKDQSYFLHGLNQAQLARTVFPLGSLKKSEVRKIAQTLQLDIHNKKDSTGICFIGERRFRDFLEKYIEKKQGDIVDTEGNKLGNHSGITFFTIGQRQGLGIGGRSDASDQPWYVVDKCQDSNQLVVAQGANHPSLFSQSLIVEKMHWIDEGIKGKAATLHAKIRYRQSHQECSAIELDHGQWQLNFKAAQRAVTPGQYAVLYHRHHCLGGGIISQRVC